MSAEFDGPSGELPKGGSVPLDTAFFAVDPPGLTSAAVGSMAKWVAVVSGRWPSAVGRALSSWCVRSVVAVSIEAAYASCSKSVAGGFGGCGLFSDSVGDVASSAVVLMSGETGCVSMALAPSWFFRRERPL